jgi:hypothetical protein
MGGSCGVLPVTKTVPLHIVISEAEKKNRLLDGRHSFITSFSPASGFQLVCQMFEYLTAPYQIVKKLSEEKILLLYWGADKSLARPTYRCILFDGENISFDASLIIYIYI